jgi:ClpP class serine protease
VGSIGVVASVSRQEGPDAAGRRAYEIVSSGAPRKRPDPTSEDGRAAVQEEIDAIEDVFVAAVAEGRNRNADYVRKNFGQGAMVPGARAVSVGMADRIATLEATLNGLARRAGPTQPSRRAMAAHELDLRQRRVN